MKALLVVLLLVGVLVLVGGMLWWDRGYGERLRASWRAAAAELGLAWTAPESGGPGTISGKIDGFSVTVARVELKVRPNATRSFAVTRIRTELGFEGGEQLAVIRRWMTVQTLADAQAAAAPMPVLARPIDPAVEGEVKAAVRALGDLGLDGDNALVTTLQKLETDPKVLVRVVRAQVALAGSLRRRLGAGAAR